MYSGDTICALATAPGVSGLAVIRVSGAAAISLVDSLFHSSSTLSAASSHTIHYGTLRSGNTDIDTVTLSLFRTPTSYTGEDVVEIGCHGGMIVPQLILEQLVERGARSALPGEFTQRAFINGKIDLTQVESVADLIHSQSTVSARTSARQLLGGFRERINKLCDELVHLCSLLELELDFANEDVLFADRNRIEEILCRTIESCEQILQSFRGSEIIRSGFRVAFLGYPNVGKSSIFNELCGLIRAVVHESPGTTRDYIEQSIYIGEYLVQLVDTAGIRNTDDYVEIEGMRLATGVLEQSHLIVLVNDITEGLDKSNPIIDLVANRYPEAMCVVVQNKIDLIDAYIPDDTGDFIYTSATKNIGISALKSKIYSVISASSNTVQDYLLNARQALLVRNSLSCLENAASSLRSDLSGELIAVDLRDAVRSLSEITGTVYSEAILRSIFANFCIGK